MTVAPAHSSPVPHSPAITYFGARDINDRDVIVCILCQQPILPWKARKRVERYDPDERVKGQLTGTPAKTIVEEQVRRHTQMLGWAHGYHRWVNPNLSRLWLERRIDLIDVSQGSIDKNREALYNVIAMNKQQEVREIRKRLGWTQRQVAEALGVTVTSVANWEHGIRTPGDPTLIALRAIEQEQRELANA